MADGDIFSLTDEDLAAVGAKPRNAAATVNGVAGVAPTAAVDALRHGPGVGVPPATAMYDPGPVLDAARFHAQQAILKTSTPVSRWASGDPAKVAATQDDFLSLGKIADFIRGSYDTANDAINKIGDQKFETSGLLKNLTDPIAATFHGLPRDIPRMFQGSSTDKFQQLKAIGSVAGETLNLLPSFAAFSSIANATVAKPVLSLEDLLPPPPGETKESMRKKNEMGLGVAFLGFRPGRIGFEATPEGFPKPSPSGGPINRDYMHPVDPDGFVVGEDNAPLTFKTQKEAAQWILKTGNADLNNPQIFEIANGEAAGSFQVKQRGVVDGVKEPVGTSPIVDSVHAAEATTDAARVKDLETLITEGQTQGRSPALMADYLEQQFGGKSVFVNAETLGQVFNDYPDAMEKAFEHIPGFRGSLYDALAAGRDLEIPISDYLSGAAGQPFADALRSGTRFRAEGVSVDEAKILGGEVEEPKLSSTELPTDISPEEGDRAQTLAEASRDAIVRQVKSQYLNALFKDQAAAGMTKEQFNRYSQKIEDAVGGAYEKLVERAYNQIRRERKPDWEAALAQNKAAVEQEFFSRPDIQAMFYLRYGQHPNGAPVEKGFKLRRTQIQDQYGEELTKRLPDGIFSKDGISADDAAEVFGYESGDSMLRDLASLEDAATAGGFASPKEYVSKLIGARAHRATGEELGFDITPESIHAAASEALAGPEVEGILSDELRSLADTAGLTLDKETITSEAERLFGELPVKTALNIKEFERTIGIKGRMAEVALLKGKPVDAFRAKQQQLMNQIMLQKAHALVRDVAKTEKKFTRWARTSSNKNISQEYMNYVHTALREIGYPVKRDLEELLEQLNGVSLDDFVAAKERDGKIIVNAPIPPQKLRDMKVSDYEGIRDTLSSLVHNGRLDAGVVILGRRALFEGIVSRVKANADTLGRRLTPEKLDRLSSPEKLLKGINAFMIRGEQLLDEMDINDPHGPLNESVIYPLQASKGVENDLFTKVTEELKTFGKDQPSNWVGKMKTKIDVPELMWTNPRTGIPERIITTKGQLIRLMLNLGNAGNKSKLLEGYGWDEAQVMNAIARFAVKSDWDFVQKMWDLHEDLWPEIAKVYRNLSGIAPKRVKATKVSTPFGDYRGGYFPISYDKLRSPEIKAMSSDSIWGDDYTSALPANPYTKGRTSYVAPINLAFEGLNKSLGQIIHDISFREALGQAARVLGNSDVRAAIQDNFGPSYTAQLRPWLEYTARERVFDDRSGDVIENFLRGLRSNVTFVGLAYRRTSALIHADVALSDSVAEVGAVDFSKAVLNLWQSPSQHAYWMDFVTKNSPEIRNRLLTIDSDIRQAVARLTEKQRFLEDVQKFGYHMLAMSDNLSAVPTWMAAYGQEIEKGSSPESAFQVADKRVRQAHGAGHPVDLPAAQRGGVGAMGELGKMTYGLFLSFMNHNYNRIWSIGRKFQTGGNEAKAGDWAGATRDWSKASAMSLGYIIVPALSVTALKTYFKRGSFVPKEFGDWVDGIVHATFGGLPGVGTLIEAMEHKEGESPLEQAITSNRDTVENTWNKITGHDGKVKKRWLEQALSAAGYWTGKIGGATAKDAQYIWDVMDGKQRAPRDFNDFIHILITGSPVKK